jgi:stress-induced-phosphoprotein 1
MFLRYKAEGNAAFKGGCHIEAVRLYSLAIDLDPDNHVLWSNRSAAHLASGDAKSKALADANRVVALKPAWPKGYSRLGAAQQSLGRWDAATDSFKKGLELDPSDKSLEAGLKGVKDAQDRARQAMKLEREAAERAEVKERSREGPG